MVWLGAIDAAGVAVSCMQSIHGTYGSGCVLPATGILWQNRGAAFPLDPGSPGRLKPGRRPVHSLDPGIASLDDGRVVSFGAGDEAGRSQMKAQLFSRYADMGLDPAAAVAAPRWRFAGNQGLAVESGFDQDLLRSLARYGHAAAEAAFPSQAGMVVKHPRDGRVEAVHDPRQDGEALGL
jgi:gamma-glutamyltranspeptidase/glutathione hydrolase